MLLVDTSVWIEVFRRPSRFQKCLAPVPGPLPRVLRLRAPLRRARRAELRLRPPVFRLRPSLRDSLPFVFQTLPAAPEPSPLVFRTLPLVFHELPLVPGDAEAEGASRERGGRNTEREGEAFPLVPTNKISVGADGKPEGEGHERPRAPKHALLGNARAPGEAEEWKGNGGAREPGFGESRGLGPESDAAGLRSPADSGYTAGSGEPGRSPRSRGP